MDLISRQAAINAIRKDVMGGLNYESILKSLPSAQPEQKKGNWIVDEKRFGNTDRHCSLCGAILEGDDWKWRNNYYCYHCGAKMVELVRYRFCTRAVEDFRPLVDMKPIGMPWWCTGSGHGHVTIVCYLPENEPLEKYWDDAFDIHEEHVDEIVYTGRFRKPEWLWRSDDG